MIYNVVYYLFILGDLKMAQQNNSTKLHLNVIGIGGCGVNQVALLEADSGKFQHLTTGFVDSTSTNINKVKPKGLVHILADGKADGAGSDRSKLSKVVANEMSALAAKFLQPDSINVFVMSLSGGTGSSAGLLLVKESLSSGATTVVVATHGDSSEVGIMNSLGSLNTLQSFALNTGRHLPVYEVDGKLPLTKQDTDVLEFISTLLMLTEFSYEVDSSDVAAIFHPSERLARGVPPQVTFINQTGESVLSELLIANNKDSVPTHNAVLSTVALVDNGEADWVDAVVTVNYGLVGSKIDELQGRLNKIDLDRKKASAMSVNMEGEVDGDLIL